jgi:hypothetical protein
MFPVTAPTIWGRRSPSCVKGAGSGHHHQGFGSGPSIPSLDVYYEDCVIGGPGSFVIAIKEREQFKEATWTKLVQEIRAADQAADGAGAGKAAGVLFLRLGRFRQMDESSVTIFAGSAKLVRRCLPFCFGILFS